MQKSVADLIAEDFEAHNGETFAVTAAGGRIDLKLVEVRRLGQAVREGGAFSLSFLSAPGPFLPQAIYPIEHPSLGTLELFIVPLGPKKDGNSYEIIFT